MAPLPKNLTIDYGAVEIKKLPPGEAFGARDLTTWSLRRTNGQFSTGSAQCRALKVECGECGAVSEILDRQRLPKRQKRGIFDCRHCGASAARIVKVKRLRAI